MSAKVEGRGWDSSMTMDEWYQNSRNFSSNSCYSQFSGCGPVETYDGKLVKQEEPDSYDANAWFYSLPAENTVDSPINTKYCHALPDFGTEVVELPGSYDIVNVGVLSTINKPLPGVPAPYFEYMFADAGRVEIQHSPENLSFDSDDETLPGLSPENFSSKAYPTSAETSPDHELSADLPDIAHAAQAYAGDNSFAKVIADNHFVGLSTNSLGQFDLDEAHDLEKENATYGFYRGESEESPSPFHAPVVDDSGFGDIREGAEAHPAQWTFNNAHENIPLPSIEDGDDTVMIDLTRASDIPIEYTFKAPVDEQEIKIKSILQPRSRKAKLQKTELATIFEAQAGSVSPTPLNQNSLKVTKKRRAHDSVTFQSSGTNDYEQAEYINTKRARLDTPRPDTIQLDTNIAYTPYSAGHDQLNIPSPIFNHTTIPQSKGFPGQFHVLPDPTPRPLKSTRKSAKHLRSLRSQSPEKALGKPTTFGLPTHPNYLFTHATYISSDNNSLDITSMPSDYPYDKLSETLNHYDTLSSLSSNLHSTLHLSTSQTNLRREAWLDITSARLEGMSVGKYRYFYGNMGVKEYNEHGMCVCWDECKCSMVCSRFGDVVCPCAKEIQVLEH